MKCTINLPSIAQKILDIKNAGEQGAFLTKGEKKYLKAVLKEVVTDAGFKIEDFRNKSFSKKIQDLNIPVEAVVLEAKDRSKLTQEQENKVKDILKTSVLEKGEPIDLVQLINRSIEPRIVSSETGEVYEGNKGKIEVYNIETSLLAELANEIEEDGDFQIESSQPPVNNEGLATPESIELSYQLSMENQLGFASLTQTPEGVFFKRDFSVEDKNDKRGLNVYNVTQEQYREILVENFDDYDIPTEITAGYVPLRRKDGSSVMSDIIELEKDKINFQAALDMEIISGVTEVSFHVDPNRLYTGKTENINADNFNIYVVVNGQIVSKLKEWSKTRFTKEQRGDELKALRDTLWNEYQSLQPVESYTSKYKTKVNNVYRPHLKRKARGPFNAESNEKLFGINEKGIAVDHTNEGAKKERLLPGAIYKEVTYKGKTFLYRLFTKRISKNDNPIGEQKIQKLFPQFVELYKGNRDLNDLNYYDVIKEIMNIAVYDYQSFEENVNALRNEIQSIVFFMENGKGQPDFNEKVISSKKYQENGKFSPEKFADSLEDKFLQVKFKKLNSADYNELIGDRLIDDLHPDIYHSPRFGVKLNGVINSETGKPLGVETATQENKPTPKDELTIPSQEEKKETDDTNTDYIEEEADKLITEALEAQEAQEEIKEDSSLEDIFATTEQQEVTEEETSSTEEPISIQEAFEQEPLSFENQIDVPLTPTAKEIEKAEDLTDSFFNKDKSPATENKFTGPLESAADGGENIVVFHGDYDVVSSNKGAVKYSESGGSTNSNFTKRGRKGYWKDLREMTIPFSESGKKSPDAYRIWKEDGYIIFSALKVKEWVPRYYATSINIAIKEGYELDPSVNIIDTLNKLVEQSFLYEKTAGGSYMIKSVYNLNSLVKDDPVISQKKQLKNLLSEIKAGPVKKKNESFWSESHTNKDLSYSDFDNASDLEPIFKNPYTKEISKNLYTVFFNKSSYAYKRTQNSSVSSKEIPLNTLINDSKESLYLTREEAGDRKKANEEQFKKEFRSLLKKFPLQAIESILTKGGKEAVGRFTNAVVEYVQDNVEGAGRHEAMHVIFELGLTDKQKNAIYKEYEKNTKGAVNGRTPEGRHAIREMLSNDFMDSQAGIEIKKSSVIKRIINYIADLIRVTFNRPMTVNQLFRAAEFGLYRNIKPNENYEIEKGVTSLYKIPDEFTTATELYKRVDDTVVQFFNFSKKEYRKFLKEQNPEATAEEIEMMAKDEIDAINHVLKSGNSINTTGFGKDSVFTNSLIELIGKGVERGVSDPAAAAVYVQALKSGSMTPFLYRKLSSLGIRPTTKSAYTLYGVSEEALPENLQEQSDEREGWQIEVGKISQKESLSKRIRLKLSFVKKTKYSNKLGKNVASINELGFNEYYSLDDIYNTVLTKIGNSTSVEDMLKKINNINIVPIKNKLLELLNDPIDGKNFETDLYTIAQSVRPSYYDVINRKGKYGLVKSDKFTLHNRILNLFQESTKKETLTKLSYLGRRSLTKKLRDNGFMIPDEVIDELLNPANKEQADQFFSSIEKFSKHYDYNRNLQNQERITNVARKLEPFFPSNFESAFYTVEGEKSYSWIRSSYMGRLVNKFNNKEISQSNYYSHPFLKNLSIFKVDKWEFVSFGGIKHYNQRRGTSYDKMSEKDILITRVTAGLDTRPVFFAPILSDSPSSVGIQMTGFNPQLGQLKSLVKKELDQIEKLENYIQEVEEAIKKAKESKKSKESKEEFDIPEMYRVLKEMKSFSSNYKKMLFFPGATRENIDNYVREYVQNEASELYEKLENFDFIKREGDAVGTTYSNAKGEAEIYNELLGFTIKDIVFRTEFTALAVGHPGQYKNIEDFYKRAKQIWSPGTFLNTGAMDSSTYNVEYKDSVIKGGKEGLKKSKNYDTIAKMLEGSPRKDEIMAFYEKVDVTDAQSYIDPFSYMQRLKGLGRLDKYTEEALKLIMEGKSVFDTGNKNIINAASQLNPFKPFYYETKSVDTSSKDFDADFSFEHSVQNKDSEHMIIPAHADIRNGFYNKEYKEMMKRMGYKFSYVNNNGETVSYAEAEKNPESVEFVVEFDSKGRSNGEYTDKFTYDSALKVGLYGVDDGTRHVFSYDNWRLQQETPEHHINAKLNLGSQPLKLFGVDAENHTKEVEEFHDLLKEDIDRDSKKFREEFYEGDKFKYEKFINLLREEVISRKLGEQYLEALELRNGKTKLPLWFPLHASRIEAMIFSLYRKAITKREIQKNGVSYVNLSTQGFERELEIKKNDKGETTFEIMAAPHNKIFWQEKYLTNGYPDAKKVKKDNPELLKGFLYRIPTEYKYSMFNVEIVEFLPFGSGGAVAMPEEITAIAGLDFDVDKVYGYFKGSEALEHQDSKKIRKLRSEYREKLNPLFKKNKELLQESRDYFANINSKLDTLSKAEKDFQNLNEQLEYFQKQKNLLSKILENDKSLVESDTPIEDLNEVFTSEEGVEKDRETLQNELADVEKIISEISEKIDEIVEFQGEMKFSKKEKKERAQFKSIVKKEWNENQKEIQALIKERDEKLEELQKEALVQTQSDNKKLDILRNVLGSYDEQTFKAGTFQNLKNNNRVIRFYRNKPKKVKKTDVISEADLNVLVENEIKKLEDSRKLKIDCKGKKKAEDGMVMSFNKGGKWKVIKDLKGYPTHEKGGVDLNISKDGVSITNNNSIIKANKGLVIKNKNPENYEEMRVSDLYEARTGQPWSHAKSSGFTDGSKEQNIALRQKLVNAKITNAPDLSWTTPKKEEIPMVSRVPGKNITSVSSTRNATGNNVNTESTPTPEVPYMADLPEMNVSAPSSFHPDVNFFEPFKIPESVDRIKNFQKKNNLNPTGVLDEATLMFLREEQGSLTDEKYREDLKNATSPQLEKGRAMRKEFQDSIRTLGRTIKDGDYFGMKPSVYQSLAASVEDPSKISHCIGGCTTFLSNAVPGLFKRGVEDTRFQDGIYYSNFDFEKASKEEGWQRFKNTEYTNPDVGDIVRVDRRTKDGIASHAMVVTDVQPSERYPDDRNYDRITIVDNGGKTKARVRTFTVNQLNTIYGVASGKFNFSFYRKVQFGDVNVADAQREARAQVKQNKLIVPEELKTESYDYTGKTLNISSVNEDEYHEIEMNETADVKVTSEKGVGMRRYIKGLNSISLEDYNHIPEEDLKKIGLIAASLPAIESSEGEGYKYYLEAILTPAARAYRTATTNTPYMKPLSLGMTQINSGALSPRTMKKHFPKIYAQYSDPATNDITKRVLENRMGRLIKRSPKKQAQLTFDILVDRYEMYSRSPERYGNDPEKFWYALGGSWQSPNKALNPEGKENLDKFQWDYSNNIFDNITNYRATIE